MNKHIDVKIIYKVVIIMYDDNKAREMIKEKGIDYVNWHYISRYQKLSEEFIREFKDYVNWNYISKYQKLSEEFIREFKDRVDLGSTVWLYKDTEFKKQALINTGKYECYDDYFIAYKAIREDNYSIFNFQYKYEIGGIYESHADYTDNEISFGLSVWTKDMADSYGAVSAGLLHYKIIKVKVYYSDIARIVYNDGKIRCTKLEVLEYAGLNGNIVYNKPTYVCNNIDDININ